MHYPVIRSKRKTLGIYITEEGEVQIRAPKRMAPQVIDRYLIQKQEWIQKHVEIAQNRNRERKRFQIAPGSQLLYLGMYYPVEASRDGAPTFRDQCFYVPLGSQEILRRDLIELYRSMFRPTLLERIEYFSSVMQVEPISIRITNARKRWGSCSNRNTLNFSWMLAMAPLDAVDYVVVHELAHILEHNHSKKFWYHVQKIMPDFKEKKLHLQRIGQKIHMQGW